jgi:hypothetical protein
VLHRVYLERPEEPTSAVATRISPIIIERTVSMKLRRVRLRADWKERVLAIISIREKGQRLESNVENREFFNGRDLRMF